MSSKDCISNLPDSVITHILSRIPTVDAVRTCVLSQYWKYKYTSLYDFDIEIFCDSFIHGDVKISSFCSFMNKLLTHDDSSIRRFCLVLYGLEPETDQVGRWISKISGRNVQYLTIKAQTNRLLTLPISLLNCASLTKLKLSLNCTLKVLVTDYFPNLKSLYLEAVQMLNEESYKTGQLSLSFPALEVLEIRNCEILKAKVVEFNAPRLMTFNCGFVSKYNNYDIMILGPKLVEFRSFHCHLGNFVLCAPELHSLSLMNHQTSSEFLELQFIGLLSQALDLKRMQLSRAVAEALVTCRAVHNLPAFARVRQLELCLENKRMLKEVLQVMPYLEFLSLNMIYWHNIDEQYENEEALRLCISSQSRLKEMELINFIGEDSQLHLTKLILENGYSLDRVRLRLRGEPYNVYMEKIQIMMSETVPKSCVTIVKTTGEAIWTSSF